MNQEELKNTPQEKTPETPESHEEFSPNSLHELAVSAETELNELQERSSQETAALERSFSQSAEGLGASPEVITKTTGEVEQIEEQKERVVETARQRIETEAQGAGHEQPKDTDTYRQFSVAEKARWAEQGANPLTEAEYARSGAAMAFEGAQESFEKYRARVEGLRAEIDEKKQGILGRILNVREIRKLNQEVHLAERVADSAGTDVERSKELFKAYDRMVVEQQELGRLMEEAYAENATWDERVRTEYLKEEERRDLGNLSRTHKTYFVHQIVDAEWKPSANNRALDTKKLSWEDQLDILTGLHPTISTSTLDQGSTQRIFGGKGGWGALLSGGRALGGGKNDIGSIGVGLRDRRFTSKSDEGVEAIEKAISGREENATYNELIVEQPEMAGVFCKWSNGMPPLTEETTMPSRYVSEDGNTYRFDSWWQTIRSVQDRGIPIFVLDMNNQARLIHDVDFENKTFKVTPAIDPEDIGNHKLHLGPEGERASIGRVFDKVSHLLTDEERTQFAPDQDNAG
jgi:hypothetical protein